MPKIRSIHPDACRSRKLATVSAEAERFYWRLQTECDDEGRAEDHPQLLWATCVPLVPGASAEAVDGWLQELHEAGLVRRYAVGGDRFLEVVKWGDYQHPKYRAESKIPAPPATGAVETTPHPTLPTSGPDRDQTFPRSREHRGPGEERRGEGEEKEKEGESEGEALRASGPARAGPSEPSLSSVWENGLKAAGMYRSPPPRWKLVEAYRRPLKALVREEPERGSDVLAHVVHGYRAARAGWEAIEAHFTPKTLLRAANRAEYLEAYDAAVAQGQRPPFRLRPVRAGPIDDGPTERELQRDEELRRAALARLRRKQQA